MATQLDSIAGFPVDSAPREDHVNQHVHDLLAKEGYAQKTLNSVTTEIDFSGSPLAGVDSPLGPESKVLALSPDLPPAQIPHTPENDLRRLLDGLGDNPTDESLAEAKKPILDAMDEQIQTMNHAFDEFRNYPGVEHLMYDAEPSLEAVYNTIGPELRSDNAFNQNMAVLPHLVFTQQADTAKVTLEALLQRATPEGRAALTSYFDTLNKLANENPEIVQEYTGLMQTFQREYNSQERMQRLLDEHAAGNFLQNY